MGGFCPAVAPPSLIRSASGRRAMRYISDVERERARWITITEAIEHIIRVLACDRPEAEQQLRNAGSDGKIFAGGFGRGVGGGRVSVTTPGRVRDDAVWQETPFNGDLIFDPFTQRYRVAALVF